MSCDPRLGFSTICPFAPEIDEDDENKERQNVCFLLEVTERRTLPYSVPFGVRFVR